jgi:N6-L-threonylcarbamoyladenine synthase
MKNKIIIGIESSCDETGIGVLKGNKVISNLIGTQEDIHSLYGGIVPELASRAHINRIDSLFKKATEKIDVNRISCIGITSCPGLKGSLIVGAAFGYGLAYRLNIPVYRINHLYAHIAVNFLHNDIEFPVLGLVISGGHTSFFYITNHIEFKTIGKTLDDACGETFDKVGRMLNLKFPGGPNVEKQAETGNENNIKFPVPLLGKKSLDFSFSGLKTSVMYYVKENGIKNIPDICASFQKSVGDVLVEKTNRALNKYRVKTLLLGGGVTQNHYLQRRLKKGLKDKNIRILVPDKKNCLDNGLMVAVMASYLAENNVPPSPREIEVTPTKV